MTINVVLTQLLLLLTLSLYMEEKVALIPFGPYAPPTQKLVGLLTSTTCVSDESNNLNMAWDILHINRKTYKFYFSIFLLDVS